MSKTKSTQFEVLYSLIGDITVEKSWAPLEFDVTARPRIISRFLFTVYRLLAQNFKMASAEPSAVVSAADVLAVNGADSHQYIDFKGHVVRNYDLQLEDIPRLNHDDPRVESMIANEVSVHLQFRV